MNDSEKIKEIKEILKNIDPNVTREEIQSEILKAPLLECIDTIEYLLDHYKMIKAVIDFEE